MSTEGPQALCEIGLGRLDDPLYRAVEPDGIALAQYCRGYLLVLVYEEVAGVEGVAGP